MGHNDKSHDAITCVKSSFSQAVQGIKNVLAQKDGMQALEVRIILIKPVIRSLEKILKFLKREFPLINRMTLIFPEFEGRATKNKRLVGGVKVSDCRQCAHESRCPGFSRFF